MKTIAQQLNVKEFPFRIEDKNGNEIYRELKNGFWRKWKYDSNSNEIYYETSIGYWYKKEYDSNNQPTFFKNSSGIWSKYEFDSNGNLIYLENPDGIAIDNIPKSCEGKVVEIDGVKYENK